MISINATLAVQVIHFLVLTFILNRLMFRPILKLINERADYIEKTKDEVNNMELETRRIMDKCLAKETEARKEAAIERTRSRDAGISDAEGFINESRKEVKAIRAEADKEAEGEVKKARPLLGHEAEELAEHIIERVIGRRIAG